METEQNHLKTFNGKKYLLNIKNADYVVVYIPLVIRRHIVDCKEKHKNIIKIYSSEEKDKIVFQYGCTNYKGNLFDLWASKTDNFVKKYFKKDLLNNIVDWDCKNKETKVIWDPKKYLFYVSQNK